MKMSKYAIAKMQTKATINGEFYECENTLENRNRLKKLLMPARAVANNKIIFPYFWK